MLYIFEIVKMNGRRIRQTYNRLIQKEDLPKVERELSEVNGCDTYCTYVDVKDLDDLNRWIDIYHRQIWIISPVKT